jgi:ferredoxin
MVAASKEDAESNARLLQALLDEGGEDGCLVDKVWSTICEEENYMVKDPAIASHLQLDLDDEGKPLQLRFLYVDELDCIGCTYCASIARNSFMMEPEAGRARAFSQGADDPEIILEAIDSCPVNCISFVDHSDLVILEQERDGVTIDQRSSGMRHGDQSKNNLQRETKAKLGTGMMCCHNCPTRGCKARHPYPHPHPRPRPRPYPHLTSPSPSPSPSP